MIYALQVEDSVIWPITSFAYEHSQLCYVSIVQPIDMRTNTISLMIKGSMNQRTINQFVNHVCL